MNSIMVPKSVIEPDYAAEKYFKERFPDEYSNMSDNPNYADSGCGIAIKATDTEQTLVIKDPANEANELCTLKFDTGKLKFTYSKGKMVDNIVNIGTGSTEKLEILSNNLDPLEISVVKTFGGNYAMDSNAEWKSVCYGNGKVVAVGRIVDRAYNVSTSIFAYSTDGITWTEGTISETYRRWCSICYGKDKFVAVASGSNAFAYSLDGITWTEGTISNNHWCSVCYGKDKFVALANSSNTFAYSLDGITWTEVTVGETNYYWASVCYGDDKFVAISGALASANIFVYSYDGITWTDGNLDDPTYIYNEDPRHLGPWISVYYGKDKFVVCGQWTYCYSYDGINWTMHGSICKYRDCDTGLICYGKDRFITIGNYESTTFAYSLDGIHWKTYTLNNKYSTTSICYFPDTDQFIVVGKEIIMVINLPSDFDRGVSSTLSVKYEYIDAPTVLPIPYEKTYSNNINDDYNVIDTRFNNMTIYDPTDITNWTEGTISETNRNWRSICYGNGKFVAVIWSSNIFAYSTDGINWTEGTISETDRYWNSVCYGKDKYVALAIANTFAYSYDGITWTEGTFGNTNNNWYSVCYDNNKFVAVGYNSVPFIYSYDGITWYEGNITEKTGDWCSVCYGNGKFVAICGGGKPSENKYAYSYDGITWIINNISDANPTNDVYWRSVCYGRNKFVAIGCNDSNIMHVIYSYDGITWHEGNINSKLNKYCCLVCYGNGKFVAVGMYDKTGNKHFAYSYDGINWTEGNISNINRLWLSVCYGKDKFVAIADESNISSCLNAPSDYYQFSGWNKSNDETVEYLVKNDAFTVMDAPIMNYALTSVCYNSQKDIYVAIAGDCTHYHIGYIVYSTDGITWNTTKISNTTRKWGNVNFCNNKFIAVSYGNTFAYSTDGINWTEVTVQSQNWEYVCYGNGNYVAIANLTNIFAYSTDGTSWTVSTISETSRSWSTLCYGNDRFVAATWGSNIFAYSTDGITWTEVTSTITGYYQWRRVIYINSGNNSRFIAISHNSDKCAYSCDGTEWDINTILEGKTRWHDICYTDGIIMAVSIAGYVAYSTDYSKSWTQIDGYYSGYSICYGKDKFVMVHPRKFYYSLYDDNNMQYLNNNSFTVTQDTIISGTWTKKNSMEWYETDKGLIYVEWESVCYGKDKFVAIAWNSNIFAYSYDGITWINGDISDTSRSWQSVCYGKDKFVAIANGSNIFAYSYNGINWIEGKISETYRIWESVCYGKDKFVAIAYNSNAFAYSYDGITWTETTVGETNNNWYSVCYGKDKFVAVGNVNIMSNVFAYSLDGITWTESTISENTIELASVCYGNDRFVAISFFGEKAVYSYDGITWTESTISETKRYWISICYNNEKFVAVANHSNIFAYSTDGITWTEGTISETSRYWASICHGKDKFVVVGGIAEAKDLFAYSSLGEIPSEYRNIYGAIENPPAYVEPEISPIPGLDTFTVGSTFEFGNYQVENETPWKIEWEIVHQTDEYQIAQTKQIIDLRCFDAKEPNNTDANRKNYGNNNWRYSNIQQWLNSDKESWYSAQHTYDQAPNSANTNVNPYDTKKGFLYYFTDEEKALLKDMTLTLANNTVTDGGGSYTWTGKVWLPTYTQMLGGTNNSISEGTAFSKYTSNNDRIKTLHAMCAENNAYCKTNSKTAGTSWYYWTSSANPSHSYSARFVDSGGSISYNTAYNGNGGVAPCICLPRKS